MAPTVAMLTLSHHHSQPPKSSQPISSPPPPATATSSAVEFPPWRLAAAGNFLLEALSASAGKGKIFRMVGTGSASDPSSEIKRCVSEAFEYGNFWGW